MKNQIIHAYIFSFSKRHNLYYEIGYYILNLSSVYIIYYWKLVKKWEEQEKKQK